MKILVYSASMECVFSGLWRRILQMTAGADQESEKSEKSLAILCPVIPKQFLTRQTVKPFAERIFS